MHLLSLRTTLAAALLAGAAALAPLAAQTTTPGAQPPAPGQPGARDGHRDHGRHHDGRRGRGMRGARGARPGQAGQHAMRAALRGVTLTEAQQTRLRTIGDRYRTERQGWQAEARTQWEAQRGQRGQGGQPGAAPDSATRAARQAFRTQQAERMRASLERQLAEVRGVLTAEQQPTFDRNVAELKARLQERLQERSEGRRHGPGAPRDRGRAGR